MLSTPASALTCTFDVSGNSNAYEDHADTSMEEYTNTTDGRDVCTVSRLRKLLSKVAAMNNEMLDLYFDHYRASKCMMALNAAFSFFKILY